ncbi:MAG: murein biosynthesis integral membrane protein MurJ [Nitrospinota bacterium]|nr:murein biosynthesis integral membrane protein MurJ [Nitrospinota bacterium]MDH5677035.1 murein biosynthesis integral membrane protein MurJ [Nitrospinota bacterium]MDH5755070.1 murein biosynthesis integral membrane protein MurJ [Nitrospinota bacterium]
MTSDRSPTEDTEGLKKRVTKTAGFVGLATLLSRITGFLRDMVIAHFFGAREVADAFFIAFRIPNLLRRYTAEGALTAAMVPVFSEKLRKDRPGAFRLGRNLLTLMTMVLVVVVVIGMVATSLVVMVIAPGFMDDPKLFGLTVDLTWIMFPYILLISLASALMGMSNSMGRFFVPATAPVLLNLSIILSAYLLRDMFERPVMSLAAGVLIGGVAQLALQYSQIVKLGFVYKPLFDFKDKDTLRIGTLMIPAAIGMAAVEISLLIDTILASFLPEGSVSYLYYANRVVQLPMGIFGAAVSLATLPAMSLEVDDNGAVGRLVDIFSHALRITMLVSIPSMVGIILLADPITNLLFERGQFDHVARAGSVYALVMLAIGLPAFSLIRVAANAFYAMKDTATPAKVAGWCLLLKFATSLALIGPMAHGGLALSTSLASTANILILVWLLRRRLGSIDGGRIIRSTLKMVGAVIVMGSVTLLYQWAFYSLEDSLLIKSIHMALMIGLSAGAYFAALAIIGCQEITEFWGMVRGRLARRRSL